MSARSTAIRRCSGSSPTSLDKADGPTHLAVILDASAKHLPQRHVRPVQGEPAAAAARTGPAIPADPRRHPRLLPALHRGGRARGGRHHRLLRQGGARRGLEGHDRLVRQGSDAADRAGRARHARHDERPPHRPRRGDREVRRAARAARRRAGADGRQRRQRPRRARHRPEDRRQADPGIWRPRSACSPPRRRDRQARSCATI